MELTDTLSDMLTKLGDTLPEVQSVLATSDTEWIVSFSDAIAVQIEVVPSGNRLGFTVALEPAVDKSRDAVIDALLTYNLMWRETGGVRFGMAGKTGRVTMIAEAFVPELSEHMLAGILLSLSEKAQEFSDLIRTGGAADDTGLPASTDFMIRV